MTTTLPSRISHGLASLRRDPLRLLQEEIDDLLNRFSTDFDAEWLMRPFAPAVDLSETEDSVQVRIDVPGMEAKDIDIQVSGRTLQVTGERKEEREEKGKTWHRVERRTGAFSRTIMLPCAVREDRAKADYQNGVLTITLPKSEEARPHKVKIGTNAK